MLDQKKGISASDINIINSDGRLLADETYTNVFGTIKELIHNDVLSQDKNVFRRFAGENDVVVSVVRWGVENTNRVVYEAWLRDEFDSGIFDAIRVLGLDNKLQSDEHIDKLGEFFTGVSYNVRILHLSVLYGDEGYLELDDDCMAKEFIIM